MVLVVKKIFTLITGALARNFPHYNTDASIMLVGKKDAIENFIHSGMYFSTIEKTPCMAKSVSKSSFTGETKKEKNNKQKPASKGKTAKEIVKRHLSDKNDKITEEDLKHLRIDLSVPKDKAHRPLKIKKGKERPKDEEKDNMTLTPWDVISE